MKLTRETVEAIHTQAVQCCPAIWDGLNEAQRLCDLTADWLEMDEVKTVVKAAPAPLPPASVVIPTPAVFTGEKFRKDK